MRTVRTAALLMAAIGVMASVATGCSSTSNDSKATQSSTTTAPPPRTGGKIVVGTAGEIDGFLPSQSRWTASALMDARIVLDPLAAFDENGAAQPYLAEAFIPSSDFRQWDIKIRPNVEFHDGEKCDAEAIKINLDAVSTSGLTGPALRPIDRTEVIDPLTVRVYMKTPWAHLPLVLTNQTGFIIAPNQLKAADATKPVGTGPWQLKEWTKGARLVATRWDKYWQTDAQGNRLPYLAEVETRPLPDPQSRTQGLAAGDLNLIHTDSPDQVIDYAKNGGGPGINVLIDTSQGTEQTVMFNNSKGPFTDENLRRAAAYALDRQGLVDTLYQGFFEVANGPFTKDSVWGDSDKMPGYDPDQARRLVNEYKEAHGGQAPKVKITVVASTDFLQIAQWVQQHWNEVGFETEIDSIDETQGTLKLVSGDFEAMLFNFWDRPDPDGLSTYWYGANVAGPTGIGLNFARYASDVVDRALDAGKESNDEAFRVGEYHKVWDDFAEHVPYIWLYHTKWVIAYQDTYFGVGNFTLPNGQKAIPMSWGNLFLTGVYKA